MSQTGDVVATGVSAPERRREPRIPVRWTARCRHGGRIIDDIPVVDASDGGLGLGIELPFTVGETIRIELAAIGTLGFRIAWKGGGRTGLAVVEDAGALSDGEIATLAGLLSTREQLPAGG